MEEEISIAPSSEGELSNLKERHSKWIKEKFDAANNKIFKSPRERVMSAPTFKDWAVLIGAQAFNEREAIVADAIEILDVQELLNSSNTPSIVDIFRTVKEGNLKTLLSELRPQVKEATKDIMRAANLAVLGTSGAISGIMGALEYTGELKRVIKSKVK